MKVSFPLSLKVSLWLLLNLLLLAAAALGFLAFRGGLGWNSLLGGASGERVQALANAISTEAASTPPDVRDHVLSRFGGVYGVDFFLFQNDGPQQAGEKVTLPAPVVAKLRETGPADPRLRDGAPPPRDGPPRPNGVRPPRPEDDDADGPPPRDRADRPRPAQGPEGPRADNGARGRFLVRVGDPTIYWIGLRVPFNDPAAGRPARMTLIVRATSFASFARFVDLTPWVYGASAAFVFSVLFWLPMVRGITRALGQLTLATERIADGRFDTRVAASRRDELGRLGHAVNLMAARLDTFVTGQKRFLGDISHELCSPLARLQMAVGILEEKDDPVLRAAIADVREEVQQMSALVNELLAFSKAGLRPRDAALAVVDIAPLVGRVLAREDAPNIRLDLAPNLTALAEPDMLERALGNLVRNAIRYAGAWPIALTARAEGREIVLTLSDEGPGVPADALARLGEPFYRPEAARTRESGGVGLGLAIVKSCVEACRGRVTFRNREPRGFEAEIRLGQA